MSWLMLGSCLIVLFLLTIAILAMVVVSQSEARDTVSTARQGWIQRRSEKDEDGW